MHEAERVRIQRELRATELAIERRAFDTWVAEKDGEVQAYLVRWCGKAMESGGKPAGLADILYHLIVEEGVESLHVETPVQADERSRMLFSIASRWEIQAGWMVRIMDLVSTLTKLAGVLERNARRIGSAVEGEVGLEDAESGTSVRIACTQGSVHVEEGRSPRRLTLSKPDLVKVIFGIERPGSTVVTGEETRLLDALFPVDYYVWGHDTF